MSARLRANAQRAAAARTRHSQEGEIVPPMSRRHSRHTTAMHLSQSGVDITVVALWLGHESPATTHIYIEADLKMKEAALKAIQPLTTKPIRYQPPDRMLRFLQGL